MTNPMRVGPSCRAHKNVITLEAHSIAGDRFACGRRGNLASLQIETATVPRTLNFCVIDYPFGERPFSVRAHFAYRIEAPVNS